jgi:hypothetical protein
MLTTFQSLITTHAPGNGVILARLMAVAAEENPEARADLLTLADDPREKVAKQAIAGLRKHGAPATWLHPANLRDLLLGSVEGRRISALEILQATLTQSSWWTEESSRADVHRLMSELLTVFQPPPSDLSPGDHSLAARLIDTENRLLMCCHAWIRTTGPDDHGGAGGELLHIRITKMCRRPPVDPRLRRTLLMLIRQTAWRQDQPRWQHRAVQYLSDILCTVAPVDVPEGPKTISETFKVLTNSSVIALTELVALAESARWVIGARAELLTVLLDCDPLGIRGPDAKRLLAGDMDGYLATVVLNH